MSAPPAGVLHTIEGNLESGIGASSGSTSRRTSHSTAGRSCSSSPSAFGCACENRVGGVETNRLARAQIEVAGNSSTKPLQATLSGVLNRLYDAPPTQIATHK